MFKLLLCDWCFVESGCWLLFKFSIIYVWLTTSQGVTGVSFSITHQMYTIDIMCTQCSSFSQCTWFQAFSNITNSKSECLIWILLFKINFTYPSYQMLTCTNQQMYFQGLQLCCKAIWRHDVTPLAVLKWIEIVCWS